VTLARIRNNLNGNSVEDLSPNIVFVGHPLCVRLAQAHKMSLLSQHAATFLPRSI